MNDKPQQVKSILLPLAVFAAGLVLWSALWEAHVFHPSALPSPIAVLRAFSAEIRNGRMLNDLSTSLYRVTIGFLIAVVSGIPMGVWMGQKLAARTAFLPMLNFFRNLSPLAWMPFAILWFGVGDLAAIFLIFLSAFFPGGARDLGRGGEYSGRLLPRGGYVWSAGVSKSGSSHAACHHAAGDYNAARDGGIVLAGGGGC